MQQRQEQQRPEQVELFLHRQAPEVTEEPVAAEQGGVLGEAERAEERVPVPRHQAETRGHADTGTGGGKGRQDAQSATLPEAGQADGAAALAFAQHQQGDDEAADGEKQVDANDAQVAQRPQQGRRIIAARSVTEQHDQDRYRAQAVERIDARGQRVGPRLRCSRGGDGVRFAGTRRMCRTRTLACPLDALGVGFAALDHGFHQ